VGLVLYQGPERWNWTDQVTVAPVAGLCGLRAWSSYWWQKQTLVPTSWRVTQTVLDSAILFYGNIFSKIGKWFNYKNSHWSIVCQSANAVSTLRPVSDTCRNWKGFATNLNNSELGVQAINGDVAKIHRGGGKTVSINLIKKLRTNCYSVT
jgi:hypothetical protein